MSIEPLPALRVLGLPGAEGAAAALAECLHAPICRLQSRRFADGETYLRVLDDVRGCAVAVVAALRDPDAQLAPLLFVPDALRELGAVEVGLVAPYLPYMRQDARFLPGEAITLRSFARVVSAAYAWLATVDPHLHRIDALDEVYSIPSAVVESAPAIAAWLRDAVERPLLVGPDAESEQWVSQVARLAGAPHVVLGKTRRGDADVAIAAPDSIAAFAGRTPVLVDDIIATGTTLATAVRLLRARGFAAPVCVGVHAVFVGDASASLRAAGADRIVTCDTLAHPSNAIRLIDRLARAVGELRSASASGDGARGPT